MQQLLEKLVTAVSTAVVLDPAERRHMRRQFDDLMAVMYGSPVTQCVTAFCWSFCAGIQDADVVSQVDGLVRSAIKEFEHENKESGGGATATVAPLSDKANVFQQYFNKVSTTRFFAYEEWLVLVLSSTSTSSIP